MKLRNTSKKNSTYEHMLENGNRINKYKITCSKYGTVHSIN
jgi:hypothetical protein